MANLLQVFSPLRAIAQGISPAGSDELVRFAPLRTLDDESRLELLSGARLANVADQGVLFHFQDNDDCEYFLLAGLVKLVAADGRIHRVEAESVVAQQPLARLRPRQYTGVVEGGASLLVIDRQLLQTLQGRTAQRAQSRYGVEELMGAELGAESEALLLFRALRDDVRQFRVRLPELPPPVVELRRLSRMGSSDSADFASVVRSIPALERYLVRAANSSLLGVEGAVPDTVSAIEKLGLEHVAELALAFTPSLLRTRAGSDWSRCWQDSLSVAAAGWWLADRTGLVPARQALVLGLLHNVGMPVAIGYLQAQQTLDPDDIDVPSVLPLLSRDITRLLFELWEVDELYARSLPILYDWQQAGDLKRPGLADVLQSARYLQMLADRDTALPARQQVAGLVRTALYEQRLLQPDTTHYDIARVKTRLQSIFQA